jgi:large subunit ribosomal protein L9
MHVMKVVLLKDVTGVGQKGTVQDVSDGYALNKLIPQKAAVIATAASLSALKKETAERQAKQAATEKLWEEQARLLKDGKVTIRVEANEKGHLYQQLAHSAIAERVKKELGVALAEDAIIAKEPIRSLGRAEVAVQLGKRRVPLVVFVENRN